MTNIRNFILALFGILLLCNVANAQEEKYIGLFVYNFTKYFDWPDEKKSGSFIIEVIGHKSVADELKKITINKKIGNQAIVVKELDKTEQMSGSAHMVFLGHWQSRFISEVLAKTNSRPVLIISEMEGMLDKGSAINFVIRESAIKFEMKTSNVEGKGIKVDPRIRELAYKVID